MSHDAPSSSLPKTAQADQGRNTLIQHWINHELAAMATGWMNQPWGRRKLTTTTGKMLRVIMPGQLRAITESSTPAYFTDSEIELDGMRQKGSIVLLTATRPAPEAAPNPIILCLTLSLAKGDEAAALAKHLQQGVKGQGATEQTPNNEANVIPCCNLSLPMIGVDWPTAAMERHDPLWYANLPGLCGLVSTQIGAEATLHTIRQAGEERARLKAQRIVQSLTLPNCGIDEPEQKTVWEAFEQGLFEYGFRYLGYRPYAVLFEWLARQYPLATLRPLLQNPLETARTEVLGRWFGALGMLDKVPSTWADSTAQAQHAAFEQIWQGQQGQPPKPVDKPAVSAGSMRPLNNPQRRLVGWFYHLYQMEQGQLLKSWLRFLTELDGMRDEKVFPKKVKQQLKAFFASPLDEPWKNRLQFDMAASSKQAAAELIGEGRMVSLLGNAIIPTLLGFARHEKDAALEHVLYRMYLVIPPETENQTTEMMQQRLTSLVAFPKSLGMLQGLLQIHADHCQHFETGCQGCDFPRLMQ